MNNSEAWDVLNELRSAVETERYALYYVGMSDRTEDVLAALDTAMQAMSSQMQAPPRSTNTITLYPECADCGIQHDPALACQKLHDGSVMLTFNYNTSQK